MPHNFFQTRFDWNIVSLNHMIEWHAFLCIAFKDIFGDVRIAFLSIFRTFESIELILSKPKNSDNSKPKRDEEIWKKCKWKRTWFDLRYTRRYSSVYELHKSKELRTRLISFRSLSSSFSGHSWMLMNKRRVFCVSRLISKEAHKKKSLAIKLLRRLQYHSEFWFPYQFLLVLNLHI